MADGENHLQSLARRATALKSALGPIGVFLHDDAVVEIMLNADGVVWVEKLGHGMLRTSVRMHPSEAERLLRLIASEMFVELNAANPSLSGKLPPPWSARVQASIPPIVDAPVFALRKPAKVVFSLTDYVDRKILTEAQKDALIAAIHAHDNLLIGGGTGSGKTTFSNALLKVIAEETTDRVHIIEDTHPGGRGTGRIRSGTAQGVEHWPPGRSCHDPRKRHTRHARSRLSAH